MYSAQVEPSWSLEAWRVCARAALRVGVAPEALDWSDDDARSLLTAPSVLDAPALHEAPRVPGAFLNLAARVLAHREPQRHALMYRLLWRIAQGETALIENTLDADVHRARDLAKSVQRDMHKMKAFVRFRAVAGEDEAYIAWFEPEHRIVDLVAPFFMRRFAGMRWAILTPYRRVLWDGEALHFGEGARFDEAPAADAHETLWQAYYANIFNPARLNPRMMRQEMPVKYWRHLPETHALPDMIRTAGQRVREMAERDAQPARKPAMVARASKQAAALDAQRHGIAALRTQASACRACPLWEPATGTVFGEGPEDARVMVVGEQPGDQEDLMGRPFIGPAGQLFDRALAELGLDRRDWYVTNAVKHFKFQRRGKHRLHERASPAEQRACRPWLQRERAAISPASIVCLGATAAEAVLGRRVALLEERGRWHASDDGTPALVTVHPAWVLRQRDAEAKRAAYRGFVDDLAQLLDGPPAAPGA